MNVLSCVYHEIQYLYRWFNTTIKSSTEVNNFDLPHVCLLIRWVMMHVSEMVMNVSCMEWSILSAGDFFYSQHFVCCMTHKEKLSIQWPCSSNFCRFYCTRALFVVNMPTVFLSFYYIEFKLFAVFIKILFDIWRRFCHPSVIHVPVKYKLCKLYFAALSHRILLKHFLSLHP